MQVQGLETAMEPLLEPEQNASVGNIPWPPSVKATVNFSRYAAGDIQTASRGRLRCANYLAMLPDGSIVVISDREAEYLLRADRGLRLKGAQKWMQVAVTNLAFVRWLPPATVIRLPGTRARGAFSALLPWHAFGGSLGAISPGQVGTLGNNVLAAQLFNGETDFEQQVSKCNIGSDADVEAEAHRDQVRKRMLRSFLFAGSKSAMDASDVMAGAEQVVKARQRGVYWEGSSLQEICKEKADKLQFQALQRGS
jgi:hypothetical protein